MKATAAISIAVLVAAMAVTPVTAFGLNAGLGAGVGASSDGGDASANAGLGASVGVGGGGTSASGAVAGSVGADLSGDGLNLDLDALLQLIASADYGSNSLSVWSNASATSVINTDDLFDLDAQSKIDAAVKANWSEHLDLSAAIDANASLKAWLAANHIGADSVIAIDVGADGSVDVYEG
ncbi:MAG: hypothetical protein HY834_00790 [Devosia nanyangense]|uniref:Uncharacterized protein n=1 Tax=Devosia nanyangense TaxID=1228055 RepID=A0A933L120_9HYPH|nr:hypothetical protein [Devosia nanyangense]